MMRVWNSSLGFVVCGLVVAGCDAASSASKKVEEGAKKAAVQAKEAAKEAKESAKESIDAAKLAVLKPIEEAMPKFEEKIKGLKGESAAKAREKFEDFKKILDEFKSSAPGKWASLKDRLVKEFDELKKLMGTEKENEKEKEKEKDK